MVRAMRVVSWYLVNCYTTVRKISFEKAGNRSVTLKIIHVIGIEMPLFDRQYITSLTVVYSNNLSVLHGFRDITKFTVNVAACYPFSFDKTF